MLEKIQANGRCVRRQLVRYYLLVEPPDIVPLVEPLLIEPPVEVERPVWPEPAIVPLLALLLIEPDVSLVVGAVMLFVDVALPAELTPALTEVPCFAEPSGSVALTPLLVEVAELADCANAKPEDANMVHRMVEKAKRDITWSPDKIVRYLPEPPPDMPLPIEPVLRPDMAPPELLPVDETDEFFAGGFMALFAVELDEPLTSFLPEPFILDWAEGDAEVVVPPIMAALL